MTVTDLLKIIDTEIRASRAQCNLVEIWDTNQVQLNRLNLSILHWAKFFDKGLDKDKDEKEGLFKRLKYIKEINKEVPNTLSKAIKAGKTTKNESDFYMTLGAIFASLAETLKNLKKWYHQNLNAVI